MIALQGLGQLVAETYEEGLIVAKGINGIVPGGERKQRPDVFYFLKK